MANSQKQINHMFHTIDKDERLLSVASDIKPLNAQVEKDRLGKIGEPSKRSVGRPKKVVEATFLKVKKEKPTKKLKVRGSYKNWLTPLLWVPINAAVKKHGNLTVALHYLQAAYKKLGECGSVYDDLSRGTLYNWFTLRGILKEKYKACV